ncbi:hypothetical protein Dvina_13925 [Dactylosporangium vinaceum]|uniref:Uncharacterized protein n=1 Tax=Dactylosporangium vinaceum TaxID=53362 RepID=A0ABV5MGL9_9ACTN|nr:hypothetical protein [Dactylosporangium vinaceum]UAB99075.1 hypothetical protein Dvina_13925 [Dactylosporangium vinaceum]
MHPDLLALLDAHLAEMTALRHVLCAPRPVQPGERWAAAAETVRSAERYRLAVEAVLSPTP